MTLPTGRPIRKRPEPVPIRQMTRGYYEGENTICQELREIFKLTDNPEIQMRLRVCMSMAKKMHEHLEEQYNAASEKGTRLHKGDGRNKI